jgi:hypothetical protein
LKDVYLVLVPTIKELVHNGRFTHFYTNQESCRILRPDVESLVSHRGGVKWSETVRSIY